MTRIEGKKRFHELLAELTDEEAFLARYPQPALLMEPFKSSASHSFDTPPPGSTPSDDTLADRMLAQDAFKAPTTMVHPEARVLWLVKSDRNPFGAMVTLGRARNNDVILAHPALSKMHCIFLKQEDRWFIQDRGSTNGTFLDGVRLPDNQTRDLNDGANLRLADVASLRFFEPQSFWLFCQLIRGQPDV